MVDEQVVVKKDENEQVVVKKDENEKKVKSVWLPLESDPNILNNFMIKLGVKSKKYMFTDVYGVNEELAWVPRPTIALMLLFPITKEHDEFSKKELAKIEKDGQTVDKKLFYTHQLVGNSCGTVALVHAVLNAGDNITLEDDKFFSNYLERTKDMSYAKRAEELGLSKELQEEHKEAAEEGSSAIPNDVDLHFICFVNVGGDVYEMDGRKKIPINHGSAGDDFLKSAAAIVKKFMARNPKQQRWNLMALSKSD